MRILFGQEQMMVIFSLRQTEVNHGKINQQVFGKPAYLKILGSAVLKYHLWTPKEFM